MKDESAFPRVFQYTAHDKKGNKSLISEEHAGMTLRDWFCGMALIGLTDPPGDWFQEEAPVEQAKLRAVWCGQQADAMLEEREKNKE